MCSQTTAPALGIRFRPSIEDVRRFLWQVASLQPLLAPLIMLVWHRLHRSLLRLDSLAARWRQGRLHPAKPRIRAKRTPPPAHIHRPPAPRKPRPKKPKAPKPPPFPEHSPSQWPYVPLRLRLRVPGLRRRKPSG